MKKSSLNRMIRLCRLQSKRRQDGEKNQSKAHAENFAVQPY